jgi:hypothetical protein
MTAAATLDKRHNGSIISSVMTSKARILEEQPVLSLRFLTVVTEFRAALIHFLAMNRISWDCIEIRLEIIGDIVRFTLEDKGAQLSLANWMKLENMRKTFSGKLLDACMLCEGSSTSGDARCPDHAGHVMYDIDCDVLMMFNLIETEDDENVQLNIDFPPEDITEHITKISAAPATVQPLMVDTIDPSDFDQIKMALATLAKSSERYEALAPVVARIEHLGLRRELIRSPTMVALEKLRSDFPNFSEVVDWVRSYVALNNLGDGRFSIPPILLCAEPGIGKTAFVHEMAQLTAAPLHFHDMSTAQSAGGLVGTEKHYSTAAPGLLFSAIALSPIANPILLLDEIDKAAGDERYSPTTPLLTLLEPRTSAAWTDLCIPLKMDLRNLQVWATCNSLRDIPGPLMSRFQVFHVPAPSIEQATIITGRIYSKLREASWGHHFPEALNQDVIEILSMLPPRQVTQQLTRGFGAAALAKRQQMEITVADIAGTDHIFTGRRIGF